MVAGAWDFERINRRYARHLKIVEERPGDALGNVAAAKALLRWSATERETWRDAVINPESFRGCCRAGLSGATSTVAACQGRRPVLP